MSISQCRSSSPSLRVVAVVAAVVDDVVVVAISVSHGEKNFHREIARTKSFDP